MAGSTRLELATSGVTVAPVSRQWHVSEQNLTLSGENQTRKAGRGSGIRSEGCRRFQVRRFGLSAVRSNEATTASEIYPRRDPDVRREGSRARGTSRMDRSPGPDE